MSEKKNSPRRPEQVANGQSALLTSISNEIRTPMTEMLGMAGLLLDTTLDDKQREYTATIYHRANALLSLVNDILDFSKIESGNLELEHIDFDLRNMLQDVIELSDLGANNKNLEFEWQISALAPSRLKGDPTRLRQILTNLASNAIKFTNAGSVEIRVDLAEDISKSEALLKFEVRDTGIGISAEKEENIFNSFFQEDDQADKEASGSHVGLAICKQLVNMMGGEIGLTSKLGQGSTFWFTASLEVQPERISYSSPIEAEIAHSRFLIVDDNPSNRYMISKQIKNWRGICEEAASGEGALRVIRAAQKEGRPFDVVLVDMHMQPMDGRQLGALIKADDALSNISLVMLTSSGQRGDAALMRKIGFEAYLSSPVQPAVLHGCLLTILSRKVCNDYSVHNKLLTRYSIVDIQKEQVRILVVEDNPVNQNVAIKLLYKLGYSADCAYDGVEAIAQLSANHFDLVLMDLTMPKMNGFEASQVIRDPKSSVLDHKIPIIAMTANGMKGVNKQVADAGMNDYLFKPLLPDTLLTAIERQLRAPSIIPPSELGSVPYI